jgi:ribosomal protein S11
VVNNKNKYVKTEKAKKNFLGIVQYKKPFNNTIITISDILEIQFVGLLLNSGFRST